MVGEARYEDDGEGGTRRFREGLGLMIKGNRGEGVEEIALEPVRVNTRRNEDPKAGPVLIAEPGLLKDESAGVDEVDSDRWTRGNRKTRNAETSRHEGGLGKDISLVVIFVVEGKGVATHEGPCSVGRGEDFDFRLRQLREGRDLKDDDVCYGGEVVAIINFFNVDDVDDGEKAIGETRVRRP